MNISLEILAFMYFLLAMCSPVVLTHYLLHKEPKKVDPMYYALKDALRSKKYFRLIRQSDGSVLTEYKEGEKIK